MSSNQAYYLKEYLSLSGDTLVLKKHFRINLYLNLYLKYKKANLYLKYKKANLYLKYKKAKEYKKTSKK